MNRANSWLMTPAPSQRLAMLRVLVMGYATLFLVVRVQSFWGATTRAPWQWRPVGVLSPLTQAPSPTLSQGVYALAVVLGVAACAGWRYRASGPLFAVVFLLITTHRLSWGHVLHTEHLLALHVAILAVTPAAVVWSFDARGRCAPGPDARFGWPIRVMAIATVVGYVVAGIAKIRYGGGDWLVGDVLRNQVAFDNVRKVLLGDNHSPLGGWAVRFDAVFPPLALATVAVELGAPLALLGGRIRTVWASAAWGFHVGIVALMAIAFPYPLSGIAYAPFFAVERMAERWTKRRWLTRRPRPRPRGDLQESPPTTSGVPHNLRLADRRRRWLGWAGGNRSPQPQLPEGFDARPRTGPAP